VKPSPFFLGTLKRRRGLSFRKGFISFQVHLFFMEGGVRMQNKIINCVICTLIIFHVFAIAGPINSNSNASSSSVIDYQIGFNNRNENITWSTWASDGNMANITFVHLQVPSIISIKIKSPGYYIEYQVGFRNRYENITWGNWSSNGDIANVTGNFLQVPASWYLKINAPGCHVEYQIGLKNRYDNITWSALASNGEAANFTFTHLQVPTMIYMRAEMIVPVSAMIDIDPNTLNLKSKGRWITCYISLNDPYDVNNIDISTILLEDIIPAEWGDIQGDTLMVKFDRSEVEDMLPVGTYNLKVTGELADGTSFEGYSDEIRVIDPGK
jgi:hypothetical protein